MILGRRGGGAEPPPGVYAAGALLGPGSRAVHTAWSPDGEAIAASFVDGAILIWSNPAHDPVCTLRTSAGSIEHLAWSPDGSTLAAGRRGPLRRWKLTSRASGEALEGEALPLLSIGAGTVSALAWSADGAALCAAIREPFGDEREGLERLSFRRIRVADGHEEKRIEGDDWDEAWIALSPDRSLLALALPSDEVEVWDLPSLERVCRFPATYEKPHGVALTPDRKTIALGYGDGSVAMWDTESGAPQRVLQVHEAPVYSLGFSPDGSLLATKSLDGTVRFRLCKDWRKGVCLAEPSMSYETEITFNPRRLRLATYGDLNTVLRLWDLDPTAMALQGGDLMNPVLFFSANPSDVRLDLDKEVREIQDHLAFAKLRDRFDLHIRLAAKPDDLIRFLTGEEPRIVHFSGHGSRTGSILMIGADDRAAPVSGKALAAVFRPAARYLECVVLNACWAETQARAISEHIPYVVGMHTSISDTAAIAYSKGFYQSLGNGVSIEDAHEFGKAQILLLGLEAEGEIPVLLRKADFVKASPVEPAAHPAS